MATFSFDYIHYNSLKDLNAEELSLIENARQACKNAYAPYSDFKVGAAVLLDNGEIITAANQESEVLAEGMCAERSLLYYVQANYHNTKIKAMAITSVSSEHECYPCGACRQIIYDTEKRQGTPIKIIMASCNTVTIIESSKYLLPFTFEF